MALGVKPSAVWVRPGPRRVRRAAARQLLAVPARPETGGRRDIGGGRGTGDRGLLRIGRALPPPGQLTGPEVCIDWSAQSFALLAVIPGSGKTNLLNVAVAGSLAAGVELVVVDLPSKSVDFLWCNPFVRPGGWGCDSPEAAVTVLDLVSCLILWNANGPLILGPG